MARSAIYTAAVGGAAVASGGLIPPGSIVRRFGCNVALNGQAIQIRGAGYYSINAVFTGTPSTSDTYTITAYKNGTPVSGAKASVTAGDVTTIPVSGLVRLVCNEDPADLTFVLTAGTATNTFAPINTSIVIEKL